MVGRDVAIAVVGRELNFYTRLGVYFYLPETRKPHIIFGGAFVDCLLDCIIVSEEAEEGRVLPVQYRYTALPLGRRQDRRQPTGRADR